MYRYEKLVSDHLDVRHKAGLEWQCLCPFHQDSSPSFSINIAKGLYICYACGAKGNGDSLARHLGAIVADTGNAVDELVAKIEAFEKRITEPPQYKRIDGEAWMARYRLDDVSWREEWAKRLGDYYMTVADEFALGYNNIAHELVIPIFNWSGSAEACVRRRLGSFDGPKYLYTKGFKTSQHLFGAWNVRALFPTRRPKRVAIVEGTIDSLSLWCAGIPSVALLGSQVSAVQKRLLWRLDAMEYVVMTDRDSAGIKAEMLIQQALKGSGSLVARPTFWPEGCKDAAEMTYDDRIRTFESAKSLTDVRTRTV